MKGAVYFFTKSYVRIALWFFYKELKVQGLENIPKDSPVIFTPNHQNSFIDAVLIACSLPRPVHYLVRASVFKSSMARWSLGLLNMMPIYRIRDGIKAVKKNDGVIASCTKLLHDNKWLMIFPEGNHDMKYAIRPLQKGASRIAFQYVEQYGADVQIVPVGIYYEQHTASRSRVLVNFGQPISTQVLSNHFKQDQNIGYKKLMQLISSGMKKLTIHIAPLAYYDEIYQQWRASRLVKRGIIDQYRSDQEIVARIQNGETTDNSEDHTNSKKWPDLLLLPIAIYGFINHFFAFLIVRYMIHKKVTDMHFTSSIKLVVGMVVVPLFYMLQSLVLYNMGMELMWILVYIPTLPMSGGIAHGVLTKGSSFL
jgi:1-acyl-sn-glycerol-3-phosphate acyltransferase